MLPAHDEYVVFETRRHGIVLVRAFVQSFLLTAAGIAALPLPWPWPTLGAVASGIAAVSAVGAVWRWDRTRVVVTTEKLFVVQGTLRRRAAAIRLERVGAVELEQGLLGRLFGYGTLIAGELEIEFVPGPRELFAVVQRVAA